MRRRTITFVLGMAIAAGCAGPITQVGSVSRADVHAEQLEQLRLAADLAVANQRRVTRLAEPLLRAAAPLCSRASQVRLKKPSRGEAALVSPAVSECPFAVYAQRGSELNAGADGQNVFVESALLRFANDEELSAVLAHEIAHNAMRHKDAQMKNALGGALLGALADIASAYGGRNTGGQYTKMGAEAGAQAFSQDFEREADYVGLYILAWSGQPVDKVAGFWRRMAVEHPTGIVFASTHPTTAERFVRLEQWSREINLKLASGDAFGPEMKDPRLRVASRATTAPERSVSGGDVALAMSSEQSAPAALGTDAGPRSSIASQPAPPSTKALVAPAAKPASPAPRETAVTDSDDERFARATIGVPRSEEDRAAAVPAYERGVEFLGAHQWGRAKTQFKEALRLDGSVAAYHAALGEVLSVEEDWAGAAAEYTAAVLLDVDNTEYRTKLKEARSRK